MPKSANPGPKNKTAAAVVRLLAQKKKKLALAESCTGGFIANRITNVPGASEIFLGAGRRLRQ